MNTLKLINTTFAVVMVSAICFPFVGVANETQSGQNASNETQNTIEDSVSVDVGDGSLPTTSKDPPNTAPTDPVESADSSDAATSSQETPQSESKISDDGAASTNSLTVVSARAVDDAIQVARSQQMVPIVSMQGVYTIHSAPASGMVLDIAGASSESGAVVQLFRANRTPAQRFSFVADADGYYTITSINSGKVLDVAGGSRVQGARVQQYSSNGTDAQRWAVFTRDNGDICIVSKLLSEDGGLLVLDLSAGSVAGGTGLQISTESAVKTQSWQFQATEENICVGSYSFSALCGPMTSLDVSGASFDSGGNVQAYSSNGTKAQIFYVDYDSSTGYYTLTNANSGLVLDVSGGSGSSGANVQQWVSNGTWAQKWTIEEGIDGFYSFYNAGSGLALDVSGASSQSGANVQQWESNGSSAQKWTTAQNIQLVTEGTYIIAPSCNTLLALDISGGSTERQANAQIYIRNNSLAQRFVVERYGDGEYYTIRSARSGKYLTASGAVLATGSNVCQEILEPTSGQLWKPTIGSNGISFLTQDGYALDISDGQIVSGSNVQIGKFSDTASQNFTLIDSGSVDLGITDYYTIVNGSEIWTTNMSGTPYLFLPTNVNLDSVPLFFSVAGSSAPAIASALVSNSVDGEYLAIASGTCLDIDSMNLQQDGTGAYAIYVRETPESTPVKLMVFKSASVRTMYVISDDPLSQGRDYVDSSANHTAKAPITMILVEPDGTVCYGTDGQGGAATIKGRGNSTWAFCVKKPYQIKLDKKTDLLGRSDKTQKAKTWILLANAGDATMLHNTIAYNLAAELGLSSSPDCEPVDLYYDGEYRGSYLLCEKVEIGSGRVDIENLESSIEDMNDSVDFDALAVRQATNKYGQTYQYVDGLSTASNGQDVDSGGYLLEMDTAFYYSEKSWFTTSTDVFVSKSPEYLPKADAQYVSEFVQEAIICLQNNGVNPDTGKGISDYFDIDSLAKVYLVNEFSKNIDSYYTSTYFYKPANEDKLYAGPVWDFDTSFGTRREVGSVGYTYSGSFASVRLFNQACLSSAVFQSTIQNVYATQFNDIIERVLLGDVNTKGKFLKSVSAYYQELASSQTMNQALWGISNMGNCLTALPEYSQNVDYLSNWITWRNQWLSANMDKWKNPGTINTASEIDGIDYALVYDFNDYSDRYSDVREAFGDDEEAVLWHFVTYGMNEGRQASRNFNVCVYRSRYSDLNNAFGDDLSAYYSHYISYGFGEGRTAV